MAGIISEKISDQGFRQLLIAGLLHKEMLDSGGRSTHIEDPVSHFYPLRIDVDHTEVSVDRVISFVSKVLFTTTTTITL